MLYFDTSALVPLVVPEPSSPSVELWVGRQKSRRLAMSAWTTTEFESALGMKTRTRVLTPDEAKDARTELRRHMRRSFAVLDVSRAEFDLAGDLLLRFDLGLRAGDALHPAIARNAGADAIVTLDRRVADAAKQLGWGCEVPG